MLAEIVIAAGKKFAILNASFGVGLYGGHFLTSSNSSNLGSAYIVN
jgi:hypothetical protein